jgi:hypothetical protein
MGWEMRHGRKYLYRSRRVNGVPVKEYLAADDGEWSRLLADQLARWQQQAAAERKRVRIEGAATRKQADDLLRQLNAANTELQSAAAVVLAAVGFHRHHRGEWRMRRNHSTDAAVRPLIQFRLDDAEATKLFDRVRAGDKTAMNQLPALLRDRGWTATVGDLGWIATKSLLDAVCAGDPMWAEAVKLRVMELRAELEGKEPTVLDQLLVRRVLNAWLTVHHLEILLCVRPPSDIRSREYLDRAIGRAQKRMTSALAELARVRRLKLPAVTVNATVVSPGKLPPAFPEQ